MDQSWLLLGRTKPASGTRAAAEGCTIQTGGGKERLHSGGSKHLTTCLPWSLANQKGHWLYTSPRPISVILMPWEGTFDLCPDG